MGGRSSGEVSSWQVYPNPNDGRFVIRNGLGYTASFEVSDAYSRVLGVYDVQPGEQQLRLMLPAGVYFIRERRSGTVQRVVVVE
ncbi:MAG: T9SS type A sorting domain-containing protein [Bacteroidia bacterium]|nr:T9SS type A sorting domain-containing protein [Bacteroidia bacterium]